MKIYTLTKTQNLPLGLKEVWEFFSHPGNLELMTPPGLNLKPLSPIPDRMYPGMIIVYRVRPFAGIGVNWVTEITQVNEPHFFVDEQRFGAYKFWHHEHRFREIPGGVIVEDTVHYALPLDPLSRIVHYLVVKKRLAEIFDYRRKRLEELFGKLA